MINYLQIGSAPPAFSRHPMTPEII